jgi:hypothetical protein
MPHDALCCVSLQQVYKATRQWLQKAHDGILQEFDAMQS